MNKQPWLILEEMPDTLGSTRDLMDISGNLATGQAFTYTAFGDLVNADGTAYSGTPNARFLYTGQQFDAPTGLYSMRARDTWAYDFQNPMELNSLSTAGLKSTRQHHSNSPITGHLQVHRRIS